MTSVFDLKTKKAQSQQGTQWGRLRDGGSWAQLYRSLWKDDIRWHYMHNVMAPQIYKDTNDKVSCKSLYQEAQKVDNVRRQTGDNDLLALHLCGKKIGVLSQTKCENLRKRHRGPLPFPEDDADTTNSASKYRYIWKAAEAFYDGTLMRLGIVVPRDVLIIILTKDWVFRLADHFLRLVDSMAGPSERRGNSEELARTKRELEQELERIDRNPNEPIQWTPRRTRFMLERFTKRAGGRIPTLEQLRQWNPLDGLAAAFKLHYPEIFDMSQGCMIRDIAITDLVADEVLDSLGDAADDEEDSAVPPPVSTNCVLDENGEVAAPPPISSVKIPGQDLVESPMIEGNDEEQARSARGLKRESPSGDMRGTPPAKRHKPNPLHSLKSEATVPPWLCTEDVSTMMSLAAAIPTGSLVDLPPSLELSLAGQLLMLRGKRRRRMSSPGRPVTRSQTRKIPDDGSVGDGTASDVGTDHSSPADGTPREEPMLQNGRAMPCEDDVWPKDEPDSPNRRSSKTRVAPPTPPAPRVPPPLAVVVKETGDPLVDGVYDLTSNESGAEGLTWTMVGSNSVIKKHRIDGSTPRPGDTLWNWVIANFKNKVFYTARGGTALPPTKAWARGPIAMHKQCPELQFMESRKDEGTGPVPPLEIAMHSHPNEPSPSTMQASHAHRRPPSPPSPHSGPEASSPSPSAPPHDAINPHRNFPRPPHGLPNPLRNLQRAPHDLPDPHRTSPRPPTPPHVRSNWGVKAPTADEDE